MKICSTCKINQEYTNFYINPRNKDGHNYSCKKCEIIRGCLYYKNKKKEIFNAKRRIYYKNKRQNDPLYKVSCNFRTRMSDVLNKKSWNKNQSLSEYIGCSKEELRLYIESQFKEGMSWDNYGKWHIDHIIPLASAKTEEELYKLFHYTNLQPLWAKENLSKGSKIIT